MVKLNVAATGELSFTVDDNTTRYIDLNDPDNPQTSGANAGKNPLGIAITDDGDTAYVLNFVSRNITRVNLNTDSVEKVIKTADLPAKSCCPWRRPFCPTELGNETQSPTWSSEYS